MSSSGSPKYFLSGMLLINSLPHLAVGLTRRRNVTPLGSRSPNANLLWATINVVGSQFLLHSADGEVDVQPDDPRWLQAHLGGMLFWAAFMTIVERTGVTHRLQE